MDYMDCFWRQVGQVMGGVESMVRGTMPGLGAGGAGDRLLPAVRGEFRVDVCEDEDEVRVVADLPGVEKANITVRLLSPTELEISGERRSERTETGEGGQVLRRERVSGYMARVIPLPHGVTTEGAMTSFMNGVLDLRLRKSVPERGERIPIE